MERNPMSHLRRRPIGRQLVLLLAVAAALPLAGLGCSAGGTKAGFSATYGWPATVNHQSIVDPQISRYSVQGLTSGPVAGSLGVYSAEAVETAPLPLKAPQRALPAPQRSLTSDCTMDEICRRLELIQQGIDKSLQRRAMPPAE
jgi:hypothetical protein